MARKNRVSKSKLNRSLLEYLLIKDAYLHSLYEGGDGGTGALTEAFFRLSSKIKPTIFCEIGAHDGTAGAQFKRAHPGCQVYSFEANPEIYARFADHHRDSGVDYRNLAIDKTSGRVKVFSPITASNQDVTANSGLSSLLIRNEPATYSEFEVPSSTLDSFLKTEGCDVSYENIVLWIDVEGVAHRVLKGARRALSQTSIIFMEMETYKFWQDQQGDAIELTSFLIKRGFVPVARDRLRGEAQFNMIFVSADYLEYVERRLFELGSPLQSWTG